ncbi:MAG TPA: zinc ribbon domain-containing protein [Burkholderiales bacterium]|jgi:putative FmdB family regulatory protein|nr:zinc ribbon domain-containing protein [Burkholderiales bacterium]
MPIYEYKCAACGHQEEHLQKVSEKPLSKCPSCGKKKYKKQLSAAGFQLKGSGWYATDFKSSGKKADEKKTETKTETKTESKPEKKSEPTKPDSKAASTATTN